MVKQPVPLTDEQWIEAWLDAGCSPQTMSEATGIGERAIYTRRNILESKGYSLPSIHRSPGYTRPRWHYPREINTRCKDGVVVVGSDAHIWPGEALPIWRAFCEVVTEIKPKILVLNGDIIDGNRISRHAKLPGYSPALKDEIESVHQRLNEIPEDPDREEYWPVGNHDHRVDLSLAQNAPEFEDFGGSLVDRFPRWKFCWNLVINESVLIRHRFRGGINAARNNVVHSGMHIITGDTHQLNIEPVTTYAGTLYGVECGMLADPLGPQFQYAEARPSRQRAGFVVLTFDSQGGLMPPELCEWYNGAAWFRGRKWAEKPRYRIKAKSSNDS
jgi:hypothetical protein